MSDMAFPQTALPRRPASGGNASGTERRWQEHSSQKNGTVGGGKLLTLKTKKNGTEEKPLFLKKAPNLACEKALDQEDLCHPVPNPTAPRSVPLAAPAAPAKGRPLPQLLSARHPPVPPPCLRPRTPPEGSRRPPAEARTLFFLFLSFFLSLLRDGSLPAAPGPLTPPPGPAPSPAPGRCPRFPPRPAPLYDSRWRLCGPPACRTASRRPPGARPGDRQCPGSRPGAGARGRGGHGECGRGARARRVSP